MPEVTEQPTKPREPQLKRRFGYMARGALAVLVLVLMGITAYHVYSWRVRKHHQVLFASVASASLKHWSLSEPVSITGSKDVTDLRAALCSLVPADRPWSVEPSGNMILETPTETVRVEIRVLAKSQEWHMTLSDDLVRAQYYTIDNVDYSSRKLDAFVSRYNKGRK